MNRYEILDADGNVTNTIVADPEFMQVNYPDGNYREVPEPPVPNYIVTKFAFLTRFTPTERTAALTESKTNVQVEDFWSLLYAAEYVTLNNPETIAGIDLLVSLGILTPARGQEILNPYL